MSSESFTNLSIQVPTEELVKIEQRAGSLRPPVGRNAYIRTLLEMAASGEIELPLGKREEEVSA